MNAIFQPGVIMHTTGERSEGNAAFEVISKEDFAEACGEIEQWGDYHPTPLFSLCALASEIEIAGINRM